MLTLTCISIVFSNSIFYCFSVFLCLCANPNMYQRSAQQLNILLFQRVPLSVSVLALTGINTLLMIQYFTVSGCFCECLCADSNLYQYREMVRHMFSTQVQVDTNKSQVHDTCDMVNCAVSHRSRGEDLFRFNNSWTSFPFQQIFRFMFTDVK